MHQRFNARIELRRLLNVQVILCIVVHAYSDFKKLPNLKYSMVITGFGTTLFQYYVKN